MPEQTVALNRRARHDYAIEQTLEAGLVLTGTEIKSIRAGRANLAEAYARIERGEAWLIGAHIAPYEQGNRNNHEPTPHQEAAPPSGPDRRAGRPRCSRRASRLVPLRLYLKDGFAKLELGVGRGKKTHDKRRAIAERDMRRELARETKARIRL